MFPVILLDYSYFVFLDGSKVRSRIKETGVGEDESVNSSGYGSEGGREGPNIIVYEVSTTDFYD